MHLFNDGQRYIMQFSRRSAMKSTEYNHPVSADDIGHTPLHGIEANGSAGLTLQMVDGSTQRPELLPAAGLRAVI